VRTRQPTLCHLGPILLVASTLCFPLTTAFGAGPPKAAFHREALWPDPIDSRSGFDRASRAEVLVFARSLADSESLTMADLKARLDVEAVDLASIDRVRARFWKILRENYALGISTCVAAAAFCPEKADVYDLRTAAQALAEGNIQARYRPWLDDALEFHRAYLDELLRLAALFPRVSSEIETYNANEMQGWELSDRQFLLTFDDGPSGPDHRGLDPEETDRLIAELRKSKLNGIFFVLGERLKARLTATSAGALNTLYDGMCVGSHGWSHHSHSSWPQWQKSVGQSSALIETTLPNSYVAMFRPPYGERLPDSGRYFAEHRLKVALWNIDSQDWNTTLTADAIEQRTLTLMLLWRRGYILFHDLYSRTRQAMTHLLESSVAERVEWLDCRQVTRFRP
jgi:peptidoglycan/xylan/chitin deacetylase (PgdA/CDA1 family)